MIHLEMTVFLPEHHLGSVLYSLAQVNDAIKMSRDSMHFNMSYIAPPN